jgi:uncharacterized membrane protein
MKAWKIVQIVGVLLLILGVVIRVAGEFYGIHVALVGLLMYTIGRMATWLKSDEP